MTSTPSAPHRRSINWSQIRTTEPVLQAMAECDRLGRDTFLQRYGCAPSTKYFVHCQSRNYDIKALAAATWSLSFPQQNRLSCQEFSSGESLVRLFTRLGFTVVTAQGTPHVPFQIGHAYTREDIYNLLALPQEKRGGDWLNGYHREGDDWYIFANVGNSGRTGHDYSNHWDGPELVWQGKNRSHLNQQTIKSLLHPEGLVHIFTREQERSPFTYQGLGEAIAYEDTVPVTIRWRLGQTNTPTITPDYPTAVTQLHQSITQAGYHFQPWHIASLITALRTKPFVILAGISGTGKSQLPKLLARYTGANVTTIPVRPDWSDSSELLGYQNLQESFVTGPLLALAQTAQQHSEQTYLCILDEMNLARVEQYLAEVLSLIEDRQGHQPLTHHRPEVALPPNLYLIGTVNMDETTHGFSRKVLDRAFTLEMSEIDLTQWQVASSQAIPPQPWPAYFWQPLGARLADLTDLLAPEKQTLTLTIALLQELNAILTPAQLQVGYRVRDEICLYLLHAQALPTHFVTSQGETVDPLDLALLMKILPRIQGSSMAIRDVLLQLLTWCQKGSSAEDMLRFWQQNQRPAVWPSARFPRTAARLLMMLERYHREGFTSYWL